jgi:hypothetical protein
MNTEITAVVKNIYKPVSVVSHDGNTVFRINMLCGSINKMTNCKYIGGNISVFETPSRR